MIFHLLVAAAFATEVADPASVTPASSPPSLERSLDCRARAAWLKTGTEKAEPIGETLSAALGEAKIFVFGESHVHYTGTAEYPELLGQVRKAKPDFNCLFIEGKDAHQGALDDYQFGATDDYEPIRKANTAVKDHVPLAQATPELMKFAKTNGIKVYAVDTINPSSDARNAHMAERIRARMKNGCKLGALIVGKAHVDERLVATHPKTITPVPDRLRKSGLEVAALNLISHSDLRGSLRDCPDRVEIPEKDFGISVRGKAPAIERSSSSQ